MQARNGALKGRRLRSWEEDPEKYGFLKPATERPRRQRQLVLRMPKPTAHRRAFHRKPLQRTIYDLATLFWAKVDTENGPVHPVHGRCWLWTGSLSPHLYGTGRYGATGITGLPERAHRASWTLTHGDPGEWYVCHHCDNKQCVRPEHLFLGTHQDNMRDAHDKGLFKNRSPSEFVLSDDFDGIEDLDEPTTAAPWLRGWRECSECLGTGMCGHGEARRIGFDIYGLCPRCGGSGAVGPRSMATRHQSRWPAAFARKKGATT